MRIVSMPDRMLLAHRKSLDRLCQLAESKTARRPVRRLLESCRRINERVTPATTSESCLRSVPLSRGESIMEEATLVGIDLGKRSSPSLTSSAWQSRVPQDGRSQATGRVHRYFATVHRRHGNLCRYALHGSQAGDVWTKCQTDHAPVRVSDRQEQQE